MSDDDVQPGERVAAAWGRIEAWLREHAPTSAALLRSPASEADIAAAEAAMGVELPATLAAWYRIHDGVEEGGAAGILPSHKAVLPLDELVHEYRMRIRDWEREVGLLPFARTPGDNWSGWYVDAREGEPSYGNLGSWSVELGDEPYPSGMVGWPLADWLCEIAAALEEGRCLRRPDGKDDTFDWPALTVHGGLMWIDPRDSRLLPEGGSLLDGPR